MRYSAGVGVESTEGARDRALLKNLPWELCGKHMGSVWGTCETYVGNTWDSCGKHLGPIWRFAEGSHKEPYGPHVFPT